MAPCENVKLVFRFSSRSFRDKFLNYKEMKLSEVLIRPVLSEKVNRLTEKYNRYTFIVNRKANKLEIKKAVEEFYGIQVEDVNTLTMPSKVKQRNTKAGLLTGRKPSKKKAVVTVAEGETIDLYGNI
jgi:large subunit ribosomal protein L23